MAGGSLIDEPLSVYVVHEHIIVLRLPVMQHITIIRGLKQFSALFRRTVAQV
jgi:hypothetical protein